MKEDDKTMINRVTRKAIERELRRKRNRWRDRVIVDY